VNDARAEWSEDALVAKLRRYSTLIGDDCAVIAAPRGRDLLYSTDFSIESVHFSREMPAQAVGARALARSLSDIAAMGGTPRYCLVSLALAEWTGPQWVNAFYAGLMRVARRYKTELAGGDLSHAAQVVCDVVVCGDVPQGKALRRDGARLGDVLYVSGRLGGWRHRPMPRPRLEAGRKLIGKATACMDISDGLSLDLQRLCTASGVAAEIERVPLLKSASLEEALHAGEDYELLFTAPARRRVAGIAIGRIVAGKAGAVFYRGEPLEPQGYDHFRNRS
jgi:thiamine-monophosphate kinase